MSATVTAPSIPLTHFYSDGCNHSNQLAAAVDWLGHVMTYSISKTMVEFPKIFRPINLGLHDQCLKIHSEIGIRILRAAKIVVLMPINLTIGLIGVALRALATFARTDMTYVSPNTPFYLSSGQCKKLRIRTFNCALTPEFVNVPNGVRPSLERINEIIPALINRLASGDDIVCLQEVFHTEAADRLVKEIKKVFPQIHIVYNIAHERLKMNSGLMVISKYPVVAPQFYKHSHLGGYSTFANIGHLIFTVLLSATQKLVLSNTHLNTYSNDPEDDFTGSKCRKKQFHDLEVHMQDYLTQNPSKSDAELVGYLHVGDYNMDVQEELPHCRELSENYTHNFTDAQLNHPTVYDTRKVPTGWDTTRMEAWKRSTGEQVDLTLLLIKYAKKIVAKMAFDDMGGCSDHEAVTADLLFK